MSVGYRGRKTKGSKAERELVHLLWGKGFAAVRAAGSGSTKHPSPDVIASNGKLTYAIECKSTKARVKYFDKDEINQLDLFANTFGARAILAIRFDNDDWYFLNITDLKLTSKCYAINYENAKKKGMSFSELVGEYTQKRLD